MLDENLLYPLIAFVPLFSPKAKTKIGGLNLHQNLCNVKAKNATFLGLF